MVYYILRGYNSGMFLVGILSWWYSDGLLGRVRMAKQRLAGTADLFSIDLLMTTLFQPFRQISAGKVDGPLAMQLRAFFDRLISRIIGAMVRITVIIFGLVTLIVVSIINLIILLLWLAAPLLPVIGLILTVIGWVPLWKI